MNYRKAAFYSILLLAGLCISPSIQAQNLVPKPELEVFTMCPPSNGNDPAWFGVLYTIWGYQFSHTWVNYAGGYLALSLHEFVQAPLLQTLESGECYKVGLDEFIQYALWGQSCGYFAIIYSPDFSLGTIAAGGLGW